MPSSDILLTPLVITRLIRAIHYVVTNRLLPKLREYKQEKNRLTRAIDQHLHEIANWSNFVQPPGMPKPLDTATATVPLKVEEPRQFKSPSSKSPKGEGQLLATRQHIVLLGEPGSGKTTTLKRLARAIFLAAPSSPNDVFQLPIVIRLRELSDGEHLGHRLCSILGLNTLALTRASQTKHLLEGTDSNQENVQTDILILDAVADLLNESRALLILDGLDELRYEHKLQLRNQIQRLSWHLNLDHSKIIVSTRSGDSSGQLQEGFSALEICPLSSSQIESIATKLLGRPLAKQFLVTIRELPYHDLADRPLLLSQLLLIYQRYQYMPEQPSQIYRMVIDLLLREWDAERRIRRVSKYAGFDPHRKEDMLSAFAFHLTYTIQGKSFSEKDFIEAYRNVYQTFGLHLKDAKEVVAEIQTHTGIIISTGHDRYEFSHLSLQEYLCANYIIRAPLELRRLRVFISYSAPLAVSVSLSSQPSSWLGTLILEGNNLTKFNDESLTSLFSRLILERPNFEVSELLGLSLIAVFHGFGLKQDTLLYQYLLQIANQKNVRDSVATALRWYRPTGEHPTAPHLAVYTLRQDVAGAEVYTFRLPSIGAVPKRLLA